MLNKNDKIVLVKKMGMFDNIGEVCDVTAVEEDGTIWFAFGGGKHLGCMSEDEFEKYFEVYEEPERMTFDDAMDIVEHCDIMVDTVFDRCTVMCCQLPNEFVIVESSACIDKDMYSEEVGIRICKEKIAAKILELNAYNTLEEMYDDCCQDDYDINPDCEDYEDENCCEECEDDCMYCGNYGMKPNDASYTIDTMSDYINNALGWRF